MIYDINREIYWKIREQDGFNPMKYVCKYMEQHGNLRNKMDLLMEQEEFNLAPLGCIATRARELCERMR